MEIVRKKICLDEFLSHRQGLVPYIKKNDEDQGIQYINTITSNSNYGGFPCDFALMSRNKKIDENTGLSIFDDKELSRFRYVDIINEYSRYLDKINNGIILKKIIYNKEIVEYLDCITSSNTITHVISAVRWVVYNGDISFFDCLPVDASFFTSSDNETYYFNESINDLKQILLEKQTGDRIFGLRATPEPIPQPGIDDIEPEPEDEPEIESGITADEEKILNKILYFGDGITEGALHDNDYIILLDDYDSLDWYETYWNQWWENNFQLCTYSGLTETWEQLIFDYNYVKPKFFKFIYDVEKYLLGKVRVPEVNGDEIIDGIRVPNYVYYLNYNDYLTWFEEHEALVNTNEEIRKKWNELGGDAFYHLLMGIRPYFLNNLILSDATVIGFTFVPESIEIPLAFINECKIEGLYKPYELSVDGDNNIYDGTFVFETAGENEIGSALTPSFKIFKVNEIKTESKLSNLISKDTYYINDEIYGIFELFDGNVGCLFSCTCSTGTSFVTKKEKYYRGQMHEYGKRNGVWQEIRTINIPSTFDSVIREEELPKLNHNVYQVVGIEKISSVENDTDIETVEITSVLPDGSVVPVSSITYYEKEITNTYSWWECQKVLDNQISGYTCGDGLDLDWGNVNAYRNILILSCVPSASETTAGTYYYMATYNNGNTILLAGNHIDDNGRSRKALKIPYEIKAMNITTLDDEFSTTIYDTLTSRNVSTESGKTYITLKYVLGATSGESLNATGIHYMEKYEFNPYCSIKTVIDGIYEAEILYEKIERGDAQKVYSEDLMLERETYLAEIIGMEIGTQWTDASCVSAYLYTEDDTDGLQEYPQINVNVSFNRGNAAAWEKRFKLSECNTMEDLENYGNNYFNI